MDYNVHRNSTNRYDHNGINDHRYTDSYDSLHQDTYAIRKVLIIII